MSEKEPHPDPDDAHPDVHSEQTDKVIEEKDWPDPQDG